MSIYSIQPRYELVGCETGLVSAPTFHVAAPDIEAIKIWISDNADKILDEGQKYFGFYPIESLQEFKIRLIEVTKIGG